MNNMARDNMVIVVGAILAVAAQIVIAPNIALFSAMPNFIVVYALLVAIVRPATSGPVLPFTLGLIFDLLSGGPVGAMALLLTLFAFLASRVFSVLDNDTLFMPLVIFIVSATVIESLYGAFLLALGLDVGFLDAFVYRALPCALYDCVVGLVLYPFAARVLGGTTLAQPGMPRLR